MANAPALLRGYIDLNRAMKRSHLDGRISERISLAIHEWLRCDYCIAAHTAAAEKLGLSERTFDSPGREPRRSPRSRRSSRSRSRCSDEQIAEVVALVALQLLTGTLNLVAGIER